MFYILVVTLLTIKFRVHEFYILPTKWT